MTSPNVVKEYLTPQQTYKVLTMVYADWAARHDVADAVTKEQDDGSPDWQQFHDLRLAEALESLREARVLLTGFTDVFRAAFPASYRTMTGGLS